MLALLRLRGRSPDRLLQPLTLLQTSRHGHAVDGAVLLVLRPRRAGDVAADDGLEGNDLVAAHLHAALFQLGVCSGGDAGGDGGGDEVGFQGGHPGGDQLEPVRGELGQEGAFGGDALDIGVSI